MICNMKINRWICGTDDTLINSVFAYRQIFFKDSNWMNHVLSTEEYQFFAKPESNLHKFIFTMYVFIKE